MPVPIWTNDSNTTKTENSQKTGASPQLWAAASEPLSAPTVDWARRCSGGGVWSGVVGGGSAVFFACGLAVLIWGLRGLRGDCIRYEVVRIILGAPSPCPVFGGCFF